MKLLDVKRDNLYLYIHTTDGPRKQSLKWHGVDQLEAKCRAAIGKEIVHSTSGKWDPNVWFQDISVIDDPSSSVPPKELDIPTHIDLTKRRAEIHRIDQGKIRNKITKISGQITDII